MSDGAIRGPAAPGAFPPAAGRRKISIVCPVLNEQGSIPVFYERLSKALAPLAGLYDFELIFTNNRSVDRTLDVIREIRARDPRVTAGSEPDLQVGVIVKLGGSDCGQGCPIRRVSAGLECPLATGPS